MVTRNKEYPLEFKIESVKRYLRNKKDLSKTSRELGVPPTTLRGWKDKYMSEAKESSNEKLSKKDYEAVIKSKDKYIKDLEEENAILKKSIGIFTRNPQQK
ncbi:MAG: transposase [Leptospiraceae bacterium]|nr:transposase [Leptospiraceae bacterium]